MIVMMVGILPVEHVVLADTTYTPFRFSFDAKMIRKENVFMIYSDTVSVTDKDNNAPKDTSGINLYFDGQLYTDIDCKTKLDHIPHQPEPFYVHAIYSLDVLLFLFGASLLLEASIALAALPQLQLCPSICTSRNPDLPVNQNFRNS